MQNRPVNNTKNYARIDRQVGSAKIWTDLDQRFDILYRVSDIELRHIIKDLPGIEIFVKRSPLRVPEKPNKIVLGEGNFSNVRLARQTLKNGQNEYYALRKIKEGNQRHQQIFPREKVLAASDKELKIHDELSECLKESEYLQYVSIATTYSHSLNRKKLDQLYQFAPLAELGDANLFISRYKNTLPSTSDLNNFIESMATTLVLTLNKVHQKHFYFLDIKPNNILIKMDGRVLFSDLGSSVYYQNGREALRASSACYKMYSPPNILYNKPNFLSICMSSHKEIIDRNHDIWSLGLSLLELYDTGLGVKYQELSDHFSSKKKSIVTKELAISLYKELQKDILKSSQISEKMKLLLSNLLDPDFNNKISLPKLVHKFAPNQLAQLRTSNENINRAIHTVLAFEHAHGISNQTDDAQLNTPLTAKTTSYYTTGF